MTLLQALKMWRAARVMRAYTIPELERVTGADRAAAVKFCRRMCRQKFSRIESITRTEKDGRLRHYIIIDYLPSVVPPSIGEFDD